MYDTYYYDGQLRKYLLQFCALFAGMKVEGPLDCDKKRTYITVPISIGTRDRIASAITNGNTSNKTFSVPHMVANMAGLSFSDIRPGANTSIRDTFMEEGGVYPTDTKVYEIKKPMFFKMNCDLHIIASNAKQRDEMIEQILVLPGFYPKRQIQTSDDVMDNARISMVELVGINSEENYPIGNDARTIMWTFNFVIDVYLTVPTYIHNKVVKEIQVSIGNLDNFTIGELGPNGLVMEFKDNEVYDTFTVKNDD